MVLFFLKPASVTLFGCIGKVYPESIRGTLVLYTFIELLLKEKLL